MGATLRFLAILSSVIVGLGFAMFAVDEMDRGSKTQQQALGEETGVRKDIVVPASPTPEDEALRERQNDKFQEYVDDVNDVLLQPFAAWSNSDSNWVTHGVPSLLALLVYGVGIGLLANFLPKAARGDDWRAAEAG